MYAAKIAGKLKVAERQVRAAAELLDGGATLVPLHRPLPQRGHRRAGRGRRHPKSATAWSTPTELGQRREAILKSLAEQQPPHRRVQGQSPDRLTRSRARGHLPALPPQAATRATIAEQAGWSRWPGGPSSRGRRTSRPRRPRLWTRPRSVPAAADALAGARDIIAERVNDDADARAAMRRLFEDEATLTSKVIAGKEAEAAKYQDYFDWSEPLASAPSHRILAMRRGAAEGMLAFHAMPEEAAGTALLRQRFVRGDGAARPAGPAAACDDCYKRLYVAVHGDRGSPVQQAASRRRGHRASSPTTCANCCWPRRSGSKTCWRIDPGFRTGCKIVCLDRQGKLLHHESIFPAPAAGRRRRRRVLRPLAERFAHRGHRHRQRHRRPRDRDVLPRDRRCPASAIASGRHGQRERRLDLLGLARSRARNSPTTT